jgi:glutaredoxin 3
MFLLLTTVFIISSSTTTTLAFSPLFHSHRQQSVFLLFQDRNSNNDSSADDFLAQMAKSISSAPVEVVSIQEQKKGVIRRQAGEFDKEQAAEKLNQLISNNQIVMLTFSTCPYCIKAKSVLDEREIGYLDVPLDKIGQEGNELRAIMLDMTDRTSVPGIWVKAQFVGGCDEGPLGGIVSLVESGELSKMLEQ